MQFITPTTTPKIPDVKPSTVGRSEEAAPADDRVVTAADRMRRHVATIAADASAWTALAIMREQSVRHLLVVAGDRVVGVVSNRDFRRILDRTRPDGTITGVSRVRVHEIMTPVGRLVTVRPETPIVEVARLAVTHKLGCAPVMVAAGQPIGMLTVEDIMAALLHGTEPSRT
jgi:CBS domain-containing protein